MLSVAEQQLQRMRVTPPSNTNVYSQDKEIYRNEWLPMKQSTQVADLSKIFKCRKFSEKALKTRTDVMFNKLRQSAVGSWYIPMMIQYCNILSANQGLQQAVKQFHHDAMCLSQACIKFMKLKGLWNMKIEIMAILANIFAFIAGLKDHFLWQHPFLFWCALDWEKHGKLIKSTLDIYLDIELCELKFTELKFAHLFCNSYLDVSGGYANRYYIPKIWVLRKALFCIDVRNIKEYDLSSIIVQKDEQQNKKKYDSNELLRHVAEWSQDKRELQHLTAILNLVHETGGNLSILKAAQIQKYRFDFNWTFRMDYWNPDLDTESKQDHVDTTFTARNEYIEPKEQWSHWQISGNEIKKSQVYFSCSKAVHKDFEMFTRGVRNGTHSGAVSAAVSAPVPDLSCLQYVQNCDISWFCTQVINCFEAESQAILLLLMEVFVTMFHVDANISLLYVLCTVDVYKWLSLHNSINSAENHAKRWIYKMVSDFVLLCCNSRSQTRAPWYFLDVPLRCWQDLDVNGVSFPFLYYKLLENIFVFGPQYQCTCDESIYANGIFYKYLNVHVLNSRSLRSSFQDAYHQKRDNDHRFYVCPVSKWAQNRKHIKKVIEKAEAVNLRSNDLELAADEQESDEKKIDLVNSNNNSNKHVKNNRNNPNNSNNNNNNNNNNKNNSTRDSRNSNNKNNRNNNNNNKNNNNDKNHSRNSNSKNNSNNKNNSSSDDRNIERKYSVGKPSVKQDNHCVKSNNRRSKDKYASQSDDSDDYYENRRGRRRRNRSRDNSDVSSSHRSVTDSVDDSYDSHANRRRSRRRHRSRARSVSKSNDDSNGSHSNQSSRRDRSTSKHSNNESNESERSAMSDTPAPYNSETDEDRDASESEDSNSADFGGDYMNQFKNIINMKYDVGAFSVISGVTSEWNGADEIDDVKQGLGDVYHDIAAPVDKPRIISINHDDDNTQVILIKNQRCQDYILTFDLAICHNYLLIADVPDDIYDNSEDLRKPLWWLGTKDIFVGVNRLPAQVGKPHFYFEQFCWLPPLQELAVRSNRSISRLSDWQSVNTGDVYLCEMGRFDREESHMAMMVNLKNHFRFAISPLCKGDYNMCKRINQCMVNDNIEDFVDTEWPDWFHWNAVRRRHVLLECMVLSGVTLDYVGKASKSMKLVGDAAKFTTVEPIESVASRAVGCQMVYLVGQYNQFNTQLEMIKKYTKFATGNLNKSIPCQEWENIKRKRSQLMYRALADMEYFECIDAVKIIIELQVIIELIDEFVTHLDNYYSWLSKNFDKKQGRAWEHENKFFVRLVISDMLNAIRDWSVYSSTSICLSALVFRVYGPFCKDLLWLASPKQQEYENLQEYDLPQYAIYHEGRNANYWRSMNGFPMALIKDSNAISIQWNGSVGGLSYFEMFLIDSTVSMKHRCRSIITLWTSWLNFFTEMQQKISAKDIYLADF